MEFALRFLHRGFVRASEIGWARGKISKATSVSNLSAFFYNIFKDNVNIYK